MQHDDLIWSLIKKNHCSFRLPSSDVQKFCQNVYNNTGLCNRASCPLANSQYATIREVEGKLYLYMKVVERAAFPNRLWERVVLSNNYLRSLKLISRHLAFWEPRVVFKVKQRFTRMRQYMVRKKRLMKKEPEVHLELLKKKHHKRELKLEYRAMKAAKLEKTVENELKERLKNGVYSDIYNFDQKVFDRLTEKTKDKEIEVLSGSELEEEEEEETESVNEMNEPMRELVESDFEGGEQIESDQDIEDTALPPSISSSSSNTCKNKNQLKTLKSSLKKTKNAVKKHKKVEFEYETESASVAKKQPLKKLKLNF